MGVQRVRRRVVGLVAAGAMALVLSVPRADAACGQCGTCNDGLLCLFAGDNLDGGMQVVQCDNKTLNFGGCEINGGCCCLCWAGSGSHGPLTRSVRNLTNGDFGLFTDFNYGGSSLDVVSGQQLTCSQLGGLCGNIRSVQKLNNRCPPCCG